MSNNKKKPSIQPIRTQPDYGESGMNSRIESLCDELEQDSIKTAKQLDRLDDFKRRRGNMVLSYVSWKQYSKKHPNTKYKNEEEYIKAMGKGKGENVQEIGDEIKKHVKDEIVENVVDFVNNKPQNKKAKEVEGDLEKDGYEQLPLEKFSEDVGVMFIGGDCASVDLKGKYAPDQGYAYAENHSGWALNKAGGTRLANVAKQSFKRIAVVAYPGYESLRINPIYKNALVRQVKLKTKKYNNIVDDDKKVKASTFIKQGKKDYNQKKKEIDSITDKKKRDKQLRVFRKESPEQYAVRSLNEKFKEYNKEVDADKTISGKERKAKKISSLKFMDVLKSVGNKEHEMLQGKIIGIGTFQETKEGEERNVKHDVYPVEVIFSDYQKLDNPIDFKDVIESMKDEKRKKGAWLLLQQYAFTMHKETSPLITKLIEQANSSGNNLHEPEKYKETKKEDNDK